MNTNHTGPCERGRAILHIMAASLLLASCKPQPQVLSNGVEVSLLAFTFGPTNVCYPGNFLDRAMQKLTRGKAIQIGKFNYQPQPPITNSWQRADGTVAEPNAGVLWLRHKGTNAFNPLPVAEEKWFNDIRACIVSADGEEWEMRPGSVQFHPSSKPGVFGITSWRFTSFPRRSKSVRFRIYSRTAADHWKPLAEFPVPNPDRGPHPSWAATPLNVAQRSGDMEVAMVRAVSGHNTISYMPNDKRPFTRMEFKVKKDGAVTTDWIPDRIQAWDACKNEPTFQFVNYGATTQTLFWEGQGTSLSPAEVWRVKVRFVREKTFSPEAVWTSPVFPVKGAVVEADFSTNWHGRHLVVDNKHSVPFRGTTPSPRTISVRLRGGNPSDKLRLLDIVDQRETPIERLGGRGSDDSLEILLALTPVIRSVQLRATVVPTQEFEFLMSPERTGTNEIRAF